MEDKIRMNPLTGKVLNENELAKAGQERTRLFHLQNSNQKFMPYHYLRVR